VSFSSLAISQASAEIPNDKREARRCRGAPSRRNSSPRSAREAVMWLYVGNLAYGASAADLCSLFAPYGRVGSAVVARDRITGRSKDFGFVSMATPETGRAAIRALNGKEIVGRNLEVGPAARDSARRTVAS
jgi:RNA recognition motif-containing protein